jgi:hypothetical protein
MVFYVETKIDAKIALFVERIKFGQMSVDIISLSFRLDRLSRLIKASLSQNGSSLISKMRAT